MRTKHGRFADIDTMDPDASRYLDEHVTMRFGDAPELHGRQACRARTAHTEPGLYENPRKFHL